MSNKYEELKKFIKEYNSDAFCGVNYNDEVITAIADRLIDYLIKYKIDGNLLSVIK
jgi:hypothetical protein